MTWRCNRLLFHSVKITLLVFSHFKNNCPTRYHFYSTYKTWYSRTDNAIKWKETYFVPFKAVATRNTKTFVNLVILNVSTTYVTLIMDCVSMAVVMLIKKHQTARVRNALLSWNDWNTEIHCISKIFLLNIIGTIVCFRWRLIYR